jgi:hypothetical protein
MGLVRIVGKKNWQLAVSARAGSVAEQDHSAAFRQAVSLCFDGMKHSQDV